MILDSIRGVRMQHVPERTVEDTIGTDARSSSRKLGDGSDSAPSVSSSLSELVFHPVHGQVLVLLVVPLGGDEACHEADDVQHYSIVSTSLVRSESAWMTHFLRLVALAKQESRLVFCCSHGLAQSPRLALVNSLLIDYEWLEHRALRGGHRSELQPPLTGSAGRKKLKVERLRHGSA